METGDNVLIAGFIVTGTQPKKVILRAIGPSLPVTGALSDPILALRDSSGALIQVNDNWRSEHEAEIIATTIPPSNDWESAIVATLLWSWFFRNHVCRHATQRDVDYAFAPEPIG